jgi:hypothetical protein
MNKSKKQAVINDQIITHGINLKTMFEANGTSGIVCPKHLQVHTITGQ